MTEILQQYWAMFTALIGVIIWLVRLEGRVNYNEKMIKILEKNSMELNIIKEHVTEMMNDIKWIKKALIPKK